MKVQLHRNDRLQDENVSCSDITDLHELFSPVHNFYVSSEPQWGGNYLKRTSCYMWVQVDQVSVSGHNQFFFSVVQLGYNFL